MLLTVAPLAVSGSGGSQAASRLIDYLAIDTTNPPGNEARAVAFLRTALHAEGIPTRLYVSPKGRANLFARLDADPDVAPHDAGTIVLLHHMDVVPPGPGWTVDPFTEPSHDGTIWGRGAIDDKSLGIAHLEAFLELKRSARPLTYSVVFLAVADEETGGKEGTGWLIEQHPELFEDTVAVLGEGGANRVFGERVLWWGIEVAQKRPLWLRVTATGRGGHGSMLNLGSAPHQLTKAIARLLDRPLEYRVSPATRRYLESVAPYQSDFFREMVDNLDDIVTRDQPHVDLFPGIPNYLLDTLQVNVLDAGDKVNVTPASATAMIDIRLLPDTDQEIFLQDVRRRLGDDIAVEILLDAPPAAPSSIDNPIYRCLKEHLPGGTTVPSFIPGITDSRYFRQQGIDAYGFSPFRLEPTEAIGVHAANEKISIASLEAGVEIMVELLLTCAAP